MSESNSQDLQEEMTDTTAGWAQTREASGKSLEEICALTHIPVRKLEAIERGDFSELGTQTFAAGYIRSYAKYTGANPDEYVAVYYKSIGETMASASDSIAPISSKKKLPILPISIGVIAIWILVMIFKPSRDDQSPDSASMEDTTENSETVVEGKASNAQREASERTSYDGNDVTSMGSAEEEAADTLASANAETSVMNSTIINTADTEESKVNMPSRHSPEGHSTVPESVSQQHNTEQSETLTENDQNFVESQSAPVMDQVGEASEGGDILIFSFSDDCWLEVRDSQDKVLIAQLKGKGDNLRLFGQAPFQVMMGNAKSVTLTINGEAVSTNPLGGNKTRKLTVNRPQ